MGKSVEKVIETLWSYFLTLYLNEKWIFHSIHQLSASFIWGSFPDQLTEVAVECESKGIEGTGTKSIDYSKILLEKLGFGEKKNISGWKYTCFWTHAFMGIWYFPFDILYLNAQKASLGSDLQYPFGHNKLSARLDRSGVMSGKVKQKSSGTAADSSTQSTNEKILKECHTLYTDPDNGKRNFNYFGSKCG